MKEKRISRREFIQQVGAAAGSTAILFLVAEETLADLAGTPKPAAEYDWTEHHYGYIIDTTKCIGCGRCVLACKTENKVPDGYYRTWIERYHVLGNGAVEIDTPEGGAFGFKEKEGHENVIKAFFVPKLCNHCANTPCTQVCPVGASFRTPDGVVLVDSEHCIGCGYCIQACPYGSRFLHPELKIASKCTFCYHRVTKGLFTACAQACPRGARIVGDFRDENSQLHKIVSNERVRVLKPELNTEPQVYYVGLDGVVV
jgi:Fe-S-cluster-containing dehydrogenase component